MHEILHNLPAGARVLDLGSGLGTFEAIHCPQAVIVRIDRQRPLPKAGAGFVQGDATRLPFRDGTFHAVIANHCLEHIADLDLALGEIGRVIRRDGSLYLAVPDASTFSDRLYRWIYHGGGHVNLLASSAELGRRVTRATGLRFMATRVLHASFIYLKRSNFHQRPPRRLWLFGHGNLRFMAVMAYALRMVDRMFGTRTSVYGWALFFGTGARAIDTTAWRNVCVQCGAGHSARWLESRNVVHRFLFFRVFTCPGCGGWNLLSKDPGVSGAVHR